MTDEERAKLEEEREQLKKKRMAEVAAKTANGLPLSHWLEAGRDLKRMRKQGFSAAELHVLGADLRVMVAAGYGARELKRMGFDFSQLLEAGYNLKRNERKKRL